MSEKNLLPLIKYLDIEFILNKEDIKVLLKKKDISNKIFTQELDKISSQIATLQHVRNLLLNIQRKFRKKPGLIADGRDMGTIVFPDALVKIFLNASPEERASRRLLQLQKYGFNVNFEDLLFKIKERDDRDINRKIAPLILAKNGLIIDSTNLTIDQLIEKALKYSLKKLNFI